MGSNRITIIFSFYTFLSEVVQSNKAKISLVIDYKLSFLLQYLIPGARFSHSRTINLLSDVVKNTYWGPFV